MPVPIRKELLNMLCCPVTKTPVESLSEEKLSRLNDRIRQGIITCVDGTIVAQPIEEALITTDGQTIYRIDDGIPVMLADLGIPAAQIDQA